MPQINYTPTLNVPIGPPDPCNDPNIVPHKVCGSVSVSEAATTSTITITLTTTATTTLP